MSVLKTVKIYALLAVFLQVTSCSISYKTIRLTKVDKGVVNKIKKYQRSQQTKTDAYFIHSGDEIIQLRNLEYDTDQANNKMISGEIIELDSNYRTVCTSALSKNQRNIKHNEITKAEKGYLNQTHIFAETINTSDSHIEVAEQNIDEVKVYYYTLSTESLVLMTLLTIAGVILIPILIFLLLIALFGI